MELGATDEQVDFPIVYASGVNGTAGPGPQDLAPDLGPLFDAIVQHVSPPAVRVADPLQLLITNLDYDDFKGRLCIGRVTAGHLMRGEQIIITKPGAGPLLCAWCMMSRVMSCAAALGRAGSAAGGQTWEVPFECGDGVME